MPFRLRTGCSTRNSEIPQTHLLLVANARPFWGIFFIKDELSEHSIISRDPFYIALLHFHNGFRDLRGCGKLDARLVRLKDIEFAPEITDDPVVFFKDGSCPLSLTYRFGNDRSKWDDILERDCPFRDKTKLPVSKLSKQLVAYRTRFASQLNEGCCRGIVPFSIITGDGKAELLKLIDAHMNHSMSQKKEAV